MQEIRLSSTDSVFSVNKENAVHVEMEQTGKKIPVTDVQTIVDQYEVYRTEASACNKYRLTLTMKPYCTNVLFNTCTEIVYNEGDNDVSSPNGTARAATDNTELNVTGLLNSGKIGGKTSGLRRAYMVDNTEYSSEELHNAGSTGFTYHPGYDILGNHIMRNLSFRSVIPASGDRQTYNTIEDYMRTMEGEPINFCPRLSVEDTASRKKHLYETTTLLSMETGDSVSANLTNENGWYGFYNNSSIIPKKIKNETITERDSNHVVNDKDNCEFIDMYPDRTLYSFTPKFNRFKHRMEKNWDVFITYPYKNFYRHNLVTNVYGDDPETEQVNFKEVEGDQNTNALLLLEAKSQYCRNGMEGVQFRSYCKHNLQSNDYVIIYYSVDGITFKPCSDAFRVNYVGDMKGENKDYYFAITNSSILDEIFEGRIASVFYEGPTMTAPAHFREMSGEITEIPQELDTSDTSYEPNICLWRYKEIANEPFATWDNTNTVFTLPPDVKNGPTYVRERKKAGNVFIYTYYHYVGNNYVMLDNTFNPESRVFGDGNTFDDIPVGYVTDYIRVYNYDYYRKLYEYYIQKTERVVDIINNLLCNYIPLRFAKVVGGVKCKYYIRMFKKLPNLNRSKEVLDNYIASNKVRFDEYVQRNATKDGKMRDFEREVYPLAFSKTVYGDDITQYQFTQTIDIAYIRDNLNRPLTQLYITIVKKNKGYKEWYEKGRHGDYTENDGNHQVEFSHCFGKVTSGLEFLRKDDDDSEFYRKNKAFLSDAGLINNDIYNPYNNGMTLEEWGNMNIESGITEGILEDDEVFFGDVVEYNPMKVTETTLSDVQFRFNTAQREIGKAEEYLFTYKEIVSDDYSSEGFHTEEHTGERGLICPEGYYYKAHYPVGVREFGNGIKQASHFSVLVDRAEPAQMEGIFIRIRTKNNHGYSIGRKVFICNDADGIWYKSAIIYVEDKNSFIIEPISKDVEAYEGKPYLDWIQTCNLINDEIFRIRVANEDIPDYADNISTNMFMWREIIPSTESNDETMSSYPFANGALYIDKCINFYLKRQDPDGVNGLYYHGAFPDVEGKIRFESNYEYIPEQEVTC